MYRQLLGRGRRGTHKGMSLSLSSKRSQKLSPPLAQWRPPTDARPVGEGKKDEVPKYYYVELE